MESEWIKVEDRLPEPYQRVLVYNPTDDKKKFDEDGFDIDFLSNSQSGLLLWDWNTDPDNFDRKVTHWMPLPKPPTE